MGFKIPRPHGRPGSRPGFPTTFSPPKSTRIYGGPRRNAKSDAKLRSRRRRSRDRGSDYRSPPGSTRVHRATPRARPSFALDQLRGGVPGRSGAELGVRERDRLSHDRSAHTGGRPTAAHIVAGSGNHPTQAVENSAPNPCADRWREAHARHRNLLQDSFGTSPKRAPYPSAIVGLAAGGSIPTAARLPHPVRRTRVGAAQLRPLIRARVTRSPWSRGPPTERTGLATAPRRRRRPTRESRRVRRPGSGCAA